MEERKLKSKIESIALVILLLISIFFIPVVVTAGDGDITIGSVFGAKSDETYTVSISIANVENITSLNATLFYDSSVIEVENITPNISVFNSDVTSLIKDDKAKIALTNTESPDFISTTEDIPIIDVTFKVTGDPGSSTALDLEDVELIDNNSNQFIPSTVDGNVTVAKLTTISITPSDHSLNKTETKEFNATGLDQYGNSMDEITFDWSSSNETVGTVNSNGLFTAITMRSTMVNATNGSIVGSASVAVGYTPVLKVINITPSNASLYVGDEEQFTATGRDQYDNIITGIIFSWTISDGTVGTVNSDGYFKALAPGSVILYAINSSAAGNVNVNVVDNEPTPTPTPPPVTGGGGGSSGGRLPMSFELKTDRYGRVQGGLTKTSSDGKAKLIIPAGTIALDANGKPLDSVRIVPTKVGGTFAAYDLRPSGAVFKPYATFTLTYDPAEVPEGTRLIVKTYEGGKWVALETKVDTVKHTATAKLYHFTLFGLFEQNKAEKPRPVTVQTQIQATTPTKTPSSDTPASNTTQAPEQKDRLQLPVIPWSWLMAIIIVIFIMLTMYTTYYKKR